MASSAMQVIREKAFGLTQDERAALAHDLVASLDGHREADAAEQWDREILRRLDEVEAGTAPVIEMADFSRRLRERIAQS